MVRERGLEPLHPKAPDPKSGASANSATPAHAVSILSGQASSREPPTLLLKISVIAPIAAPTPAIVIGTDP